MDDGDVEDYHNAISASNRGQESHKINSPTIVLLESSNKYQGVEIQI